MDVIIRANEQIPVIKWRKGPQAFTTQRDGQESIRFRIYQGERPIAADNEFVGEVVLHLATTRPAGEIRVNCMFKVDHDGILHVRAEDTSTEGQPVEKTVIGMDACLMSMVEVAYQLRANANYMVASQEKEPLSG